MKTVAYIVDNTTLQSFPPAEAFEANPIPADSTKSLVYVHWDNPNWEERFEATPGVMWLGFLWEAPPAEAVPLIQSFYQANTDLVATQGLAIPSVDAPPESLGSMLRKAGQTGRRLA